MQANNGVVLTRPELLCFGVFLMMSICLVLALRHPKQVVAAVITLPISALCGGFAYLIAGVMYNAQTAALYGMAAFAVTGLIIVSALRWLGNLDTF